MLVKTGRSEPVEPETMNESKNARPLDSIEPGDVVERHGVDKQGDPYTKKAIVDDVADTGDFISIRRYAPHTHPEKGLFSADEWAESDWHAVDEGGA